jgi:hydroxymethylpyrimidine pyrophosphatase-like HAD family hydrolase
MRIFVDVDGTLTHIQPGKPVTAPPRQDVVDKVKALIEAGHVVVVWSGKGARHARMAAKLLGIKAVACLRKPHLIIDDEAEKVALKLARSVITPEKFLAMDFENKPDDIEGEI